MNAKISVFVICVEAIIYLLYITCMTVPLTWVISEQFNRRDFKAMAFFVLLFKMKFSKGLDVFAIKASDDTSIKNA